MEKIYLLPSLTQTQKLAQEIACRLELKDIVLLKGDLGAGKTELARFILKTLNPKIQHIPSPTFTLAQTYETSLGLVWHFDLYRLKTFEEVFELGIEEAFSTGISLIEWPERLSNLKLPQGVLGIYLNIISKSSSNRQAKLHFSESWIQRGIW